MRAKELIKLLQMNPEAEVFVRLDGSIFPTDAIAEHLEYKQFNCSEDEVFVLALLEEVEE